MENDRPGQFSAEGGGRGAERATAVPHAYDRSSPSDGAGDQPFRHMVRADGATGWRCTDCRIWFPTWPSDMEPCPGVGKFCPRCRSEVVDHPMSEFASDDPDVREWQCGRCAGGTEALFLAGEATYEN